MTYFTVEYRTTCKVCGGDIEQKRFRTYCSAKCRTKAVNERYRFARRIWQRRRLDKKNETPSPNKIQCLLCKRWYIQICSHTYTRHGVSAREYKKMCEKDTVKGLVPEWYHKEKSEITLENGTGDILKKVGEKTRFKKGQKGLGRYTRSRQTLERLKLNTVKKKQYGGT